MLTTTTKTPAIRFLRHFVTNGSAKCRVHYSYGANHDGSRGVTIYAKGYLDDLTKVFGDSVKNETDLMTDYHEVDHVRIDEGHPLFAAAKAAHDQVEQAWADHKARLQARRAARPSVGYSYLAGGFRTHDKRTGEPFAIGGTTDFATRDDLIRALATIGMRLSSSNWQPVTATKHQLEQIAARYGKAN